ncbi:coiled-coil domain-containing protein 77-like [Mizuhopecten yessoensis]|uniref:Coiled-coil domain-containing protein 77 n=1 Tax=Mizuhopecten yessoensis TaxID=6573 RepID=A0A210R499_MIZYE|nr:coiled-coil domain-containing protein 77-like [Mizuhopecten yessoensis]OWF55724.1 Coiled-coil domain-containing protein 77 [Mizuhopecten yessoensis]
MASAVGKRSKGGGKERGSPKVARSVNISTAMDSTVADQDESYAVENGSPDLPTINERLGQLRPSRELLEYYRKKIAEYDEEHDFMVSKLEEYKITYEEQHKLQWELRQREEEIVELQKALSDMQIYLFQEREHVLRLYAENDRLKIRELEDKKKIQQLLSLSGTIESEITYFLKEPPAKAIVEQKTKNRPQSAAEIRQNRGLKKKQLPLSERRQSMSPNPEEKYKHDNEVLALQVEALQAQLQEQTKIAKEQTEALTEDRKVKEEEMTTRQQRDEAKIHTLTEKLHKTQDLLYESTKDFLELRYQGRANERQWMAEKDCLLREMDGFKQQLNISKESVLNVTDGGTYEGRAHYIEETKALEYQLQQSQKLAEMYREQVIQLEDELSRIREEGDVTREVFKGRSDKMTKRLTMMNQRYQDLERRRNLEVEGFKNDIKNLRSRLKDVERQLYKVTMGFAEDMDMKRPDDIDMQILRNVHATAGRSKKIVGELKNLKAKMYGIENNLKHL